MKLAVVGSAAAVLVVVGGGVAAGVLASDDDADDAGSVVRAPAEALAVPMELSASRYGVAVRMHARVQEATTLDGAVLRGAFEHDEALLWPLGGGADGEYVPRVSLGAGDRVQVDGYLSPDCGLDDPAAGDVVVELGTQDGRDPAGTLSFVLDDADDFETAVADWCALGPSVDPTGSMTSPDGTGEAYLDISNPGPGAVEVSLPAGGGWAAASTTVPPGTTGASLTLRASSADCDIDAALPWADGRLQVDGEPYPITLEDSWCG